MSTFNGVVEEFPDIRIDYFRHIPGSSPPLVCLLSHVHSDHLRGLESLRSPFVYCSLATKEILLRLEKYPHRMNFAKGILESRKTHYRHLKNLLKVIPLNTPTEIELAPGRTIQVTLLDANHCIGAVMFLIVNAEKAILYTGDIRSEPWWVNALIRNPVVLPYSIGIRRLDKLYLDTTFATKRDSNRTFPSKADGLKELLLRVSEYPQGTIFYFNAWTFGYEEVYLALASMLGSKIHVDPYKLKLYRSVARASGEGAYVQDGAALSGFTCGNREQPGCLTADGSVRLHSCERGTVCQRLESSHVVWITPIITRGSGGQEFMEMGAGGGGGDLEQVQEVEILDSSTALEFAKICSQKIADRLVREKVLALVSEAVTSGKYTLLLDGLDLQRALENMPLGDFVGLIIDMVQRSMSTKDAKANASNSLKNGNLLEGLPKEIKFPYSRHSSYEELRHLVQVLKPRDIYPCTVDEELWNPKAGMKELFGDLCSAQTFTHDHAMRARSEARRSGPGRKRKFDNTPSSSNVAHDSASEPGLSNSDAELVGMLDLRDPVRVGPVRDDWYKKIESLGQAQIRPRDEASGPLPRARHASADTSSDQRILHVKVSFEADHERDIAFQSLQAYSAPAETSRTKLADGIRNARTHASHLKARGTIGLPTDFTAIAASRWGLSKTTCWNGLEERYKDVQPGNIDQLSQKECDTPIELVDISTALDTWARGFDVTLESFSDRPLGRQSKALADDLECSLIMARTIINIRGFRPSRIFLGRESELAESRTMDNPIVLHLKKENTLRVRSIFILRELLPTACERSCQESLEQCGGNLRKARDQLALSEEERFLQFDKSGLDASAETTRDSEEQEESQFSLLGSAFASQGSADHHGEVVRARLDRRKEAYKAAGSSDGREWHKHSPFFSSSANSKEDMEL